MRFSIHSKSTFPFTELRETESSGSQSEMAAESAPPERGNADFAAIIAALTQICCDPASRRIAGLCDLIDKEFVAAGHQFRERLAIRQSQGVRAVSLY